MRYAFVTIHPAAGSSYRTRDIGSSACVSAPPAITVAIAVLVPVTRITSLFTPNMICRSIILFLVLFHSSTALNSSEKIGSNSSVDGSVKQQERPEVDFERKIISLQVVNGSQASLMCSVTHLGQHQVSWIHVDKQLLLTTQDVVRVSNPRVGIRRQNDTFILVIDKTSLDDVGYYACRINSHPPKSQLGFLDVLVPPYFLSTSSESDATVTVKEYSNAGLECRAAANPPPVIMWHREDGQAIAVKVPAKETEVSGDVLTLNQVTRQATGVYVCVVTSGISPPISRRITLLVQFAPMIRIPSQVVLAGVGQTATLECWTEWFGTLRQPIFESQNKTNQKYYLTSERTYYFSVMYRLKVTNLTISDAGRYSCLIRNDFGAAQSELTLHVAENAKHITTGNTTPVSPVFTAISQTKREQKRKKVATATGTHYYWPSRQLSTTTIIPITTTTSLVHRLDFASSKALCCTNSHVILFVIAIAILFTVY